MTREIKNAARLAFLEQVQREVARFDESVGATQDPVFLVLRAHLFCEQLVEAILRSHLPRPGRLLGRNTPSFARKVMILEALDVVDRNLCVCLFALNSVRNKCAHELGAVIAREDVARIAEHLHLFSNHSSKPRPAKALRNVLRELVLSLAIQVRGPHDSSP